MPAKPICLVLGDIHLDQFIWRKYRQITGDAFTSFTSLIDATIRLHVDLVLVGDIFDNVTPDTALIQFFRRSMQRVVDAGLHVYAIQGNHDKRPQVPWYSAIHEAVVHIGDGVPRDIGPLRVVGLDYSTRDVIEAKIATLDAIPGRLDVLFIHQAVRQALPWEGAWNCDLDWIPARVGVVLMGDIHQKFKHTIRPGQDAYYTGASHMRSLPEAGPKSAMLLHDDLSLTDIPLVTRSLQKFTISTPDELGPVVEWLREHSREPLPPVAWVYYAEAIGHAVLGLVAHCTEGIVVAEPVDTKHPGAGRDDTSPDPRSDLISFEAVMNQLVDPIKDPGAHSFVYDLFKDPRPTAEVISAQREKYLT